MTRWLARRTRRFWFSAGGTVAGIAVLVVGGLALLAWQASAHSPGRAATAYLRALASRDVAAMLQNAEIVPPTTEGTHDVTLLSPKDVRQELAASANAMGPIGNIRVVHSQVAGDQASVSVQYTARAQSITQTYTVIRATSPTGWAVQVYPGHLGISAPPGTTQVTVAGIPVPISGGTTTAYVFPASMSVDSLASPAFGATSTVADVALGQAQVTVSPPLAPGAATAITRLVTTQLNACLASGSLTPDNCPNSDDSFPCTEGDTCTNVQWQASGALGADLQVVDVDGDVTANGTLTAADTYLDSTPPTPYDSGSSITQTDGPTTWQYQYPVTYTGGRWTLGPVQASESY